MDNNGNRNAQRRNNNNYDNPCGCGCGGASNVKDCAALLKQLQTLDFALTDVILYLDSYPDNCEALECYRNLMNKRECAAKAYETQCGPLTAMGNGRADGWRWIKNPWPWEVGNISSGSCNCKR